MICPRIAIAPVPRVQTLDLVKSNRARIIQVSRSEPVEKVERRVMRISAYTAHDKGMDGKHITANGERTQEGRTIAADKSIPFGTEIYIPALDKHFTVTDRGGAIYGDRLDMYVESRKDAMKFGVKYLEVLVRYP